MKVKNSLSIGLLGCVVFAGLSSTALGQSQSPPSTFQPSNSTFQPGSAGSFSPQGRSATGLSPAGTIGQNTGGFQSRPSNYQPPTSSFNQSPFGSTGAAKINWLDGKQLAQAQQLSRQTNKPIMLHFWNERCGPCLALDRNVFPNPSVVNAINSQFIAVKVNTDETPEIHQNYGVSRWPWDVFLAPDGRKLTSKQSPPTAGVYSQQVNTAASMFQQYAKFADVSSSPKSANTSLGNSASPFPGSSVRQTNFTQQSQAQQYQAQTAPKPSSNWPPQTGSTSGGAGFAQTMNRNQPTGSNPNNSTGTPSGTVQNQFYNKPTATGNHYAGNVGQPNTPSAPTTFANSKSAAQTGTTPIGLEGKCPVTLLKSEKWVSGSKEWGCRHRGKLYFFTSREYRDEFIKSPDQFAPVLAGYDVVEFRETGRFVEGKNSIGIFAGNENARQVYRFASKENMQKFKNDSGRYNDAVRTAMETANSRMYR